EQDHAAVVTRNITELFISDKRIDRAALERPLLGAVGTGHDLPKSGSLGVRCREYRPPRLGAIALAGLSTLRLGIVVGHAIAAVAPLTSALSSSKARHVVERHPIGRCHQRS